MSDFYFIKKKSTGGVTPPVDPGTGVTFTGGDPIWGHNLSTTWTVPEGCTSVKIECWGHGGSGAYGSFVGEVGGGGGGYNTHTMNVSAGSIYTVKIGDPANPASTNSPAYVASGTTYYAKAESGYAAAESGYGPTGGGGGSYECLYSGGNGDVGYGGGSAGNEGNASGSSGGAGLSGNGDTGSGPGFPGGGANGEAEGAYGYIIIHYNPS